MLVADLAQDRVVLKVGVVLGTVCVGAVDAVLDGTVAAGYAVMPRAYPLLAGPATKI
jgi:hypothetical protein